jgi:hypothetical protein
MKRNVPIAEEANKKSRAAETPAAAEDLTQKNSTQLEQLSLVQDDIEKLNAEADEEKLKIERKYAEMKRPHMRRRNDISSTIPGFWLSCVS